MTQIKKLKRKALSWFLALAMVLSTFAGIVPGMSLTAWAASTTYIDGSGTSQTVDATELAANTTSWTDGSWYIVPAGGLTISGRIAVNGTVNLILRDGATLTASAGIRTTGATLNIYAQSAGTGALTAKGSNGDITDGGSAGIGGNGKVGSDGDGYPIAGAGGTVNIYGGAVTATGGNGGQYSGGGAGIGGGGLGWKSTGGGCGTVSIYGGTVTATGGSGMNTAPGIGGGAAGYDCSAGASGTLTLGKGVKLYNGTNNSGTVLDGNDSTERSYSSSRPQNMFAEFISAGSVDEITWEGSILNSLTDSNGITVTGDGIAYAAVGLMFEQNRGPINFSASNGYFTKIVITCNELENRSGATISGFTQSGNTLTWTGESANVTIPQNPRGLSLYGVTSIKFTGVGLIPTVDKSALETAITAAETLYDSIKDDTNYSTIASTLKTAIDAAKEVADSDTADQNAVDAATTAITTAKTNAEAAKKDVDDTTEANKVSTLIADLPAKEAITKDDKTKVEAAKAAYDELTNDQKAKVSPENKQKLNDAVEAIAAIEKKDEADTAAAKKVEDAINALPAADKVTVNDKKAIEDARKAYDELTDDQKAKVPADAVKKLEDVEKALAAAEKKAAEDKAAAEKKAAEEKAAKELAAAKKAAQAAMNSEIVVTQKGNKIIVKWTKAKSAEGYEVYAQYCGKKFKKPVKNIKKNSITKLNIKKINGKKINLKKQFKVYVLAYKKVNGKKVVLAKSNVGHIVGVKNKKFTNVKTLKLKKKTYTVEVGKTANVKAKVTIVDKSKKHIASKHIAKFRYRTSDESIATVSKKGKIKGISKGKCKIYVYAANGKMKKATVTVK